MWYWARKAWLRRFWALSLPISIWTRPAPRILRRRRARRGWKTDAGTQPQKAVGSGRCDAVRGRWLPRLPWPPRMPRGTRRPQVPRVREARQQPGGGASTASWLVAPERPAGTRASLPGGPHAGCPLGRRAVRRLRRLPAGDTARGTHALGHKPLRAGRAIPEPGRFRLRRTAT
jgi:hypothetical protein